MDCKEARDRLWQANILRASDAEVEAALEHAEACDACRPLLDGDRRMAELIRASVPRLRAPQEVKERVYAALSREGVSPEVEIERIADSGTEFSAVSSHRRVGGIAIACAVTLIIGFAAYRLATRATDVPAATAFAEDYLRRHAEPEEPWSGDPGEIASFFARELGLSMPPAEIADFEVERASTCVMNGRRGGVVEYRSRGRRLTYYVIPGDPRDEEGARAGRQGKDLWVSPTPSIAEERGLGVATWRDSRHQHALVGDISSYDLQRLSALFLTSREGP